MASDLELRALAEYIGNGRFCRGKCLSTTPASACDCKAAAQAILGLLESRAIMDGAADELGRQLAAAEAALQSSKLDCLSLETQLAETQARLAKAVEALREIDGHLTNMQPKLVNGPLALDKDRLAMVDRYVGPAIEAARSVLTSLESRDE